MRWCDGMQLQLTCRCDCRFPGTSTRCIPSHHLSHPFLSFSLSPAGANHLFVMDPVLSPAVTAQLIGRIARMSQTRPCYVYHLAAIGSVEERMIVWRAALARGNGHGRAAGDVDASAKVALRQSQAAKNELADANTGAAERLAAADLLTLLDPDGYEDEKLASGEVDAADDDEELDDSFGGDNAGVAGSSAGAAAKPTALTAK